MSDSPNQTATDTDDGPNPCPCDAPYCRQRDERAAWEAKQRPRAENRPINIGATWVSPLHTRLITELWPQRFGQDAAVQYREGGSHRTISLVAFRGWIWKERAVKVEVENAGR